VALKWGSLSLSHTEAVLWDGGLGGAIVEVRDSDNTGEAAPINSFSERARARREQKERCFGFSLCSLARISCVVHANESSARPRTSLNAAA